MTVAASGACGQAANFAQKAIHEPFNRDTEQLGGSSNVYAKLASGEFVVE